MKFRQQPSGLLMVRPAAFGFNPLTAASNVFQRATGMGMNDTLNKAQAEFDRMVDLLISHEIEVRVFEDTPSPEKPDAVFPNNWISFHEDGTVVLYPMMAENRRLERRLDIPAALKKDFEVNRIIDLSTEEKNSRFLEGTGSVVFDHVNRIGYACRSPRTDTALVIQLCKTLDYRPVIFDAFDGKGIAIYHTNVMLCVGEKFAVLCLDAVKDDADQELLLTSFSLTDHKVIAISYEQMNSFSGNMIEVMTKNGEPIVLVSQSALQSLLPGQIKAINQFCEMLPIPIPVIEKTGGGSVRCMVAGLPLPKAKSDLPIELAPKMS
jgi:hypothetical protein